MKVTVHHINPETTVKAWYKAAAPWVEQSDLIRPDVTFDAIIRYGENDPARVCELLGVTDIDLAEDVLNEMVLVLRHMEGRYKYRSLSELKARRKPE